MFWIILCLAVLAVLSGARAMKRQMDVGLSATGLSDQVSWGLYVQGFLTLASLAGGVLFLAGVSGLFQGEAWFAPQAGVLALGCLAGGGLLLLADLGKPLRSHLLVLGKNASSSTTWDFYLFALCGLLALAALIHSAAGHTPGRLWSVLTVFFSAAFLLAHALLLLSRQNNPVAHPFLGLETFSRAVWGGAALLCLTLPKTGNAIRVQEVFLLCALLVTLIHIAFRFARPRPERASAFAWFHPLIAADALVAILLLFGIYSAVPLLVGIAAIIALALLVWEKVCLVRAFQAGTALPAPYAQWQTVPPYAPSRAEFHVLLGGLGATVFVAQIAYLLAA